MARNAGGGVLPGLVAAAFSARVAKGWRCTTSLVGDAIERRVRRILSGLFLGAGVTKAEEDAAFARGQVKRRLESIGRSVHEFAEAAQDGACVANGVMDVAGDDRADGMEFGLEGCRDAEVRAGTAESPEELGISLCVHIQRARIGGDEARGKEVVTAGAEEPREPAEPAAEREAGGAHAWALAQDRDKAVPAGGTRDFPAQDARLRAHDATVSIDADLFEWGK